MINNYRAEMNMVKVEKRIEELKEEVFEKYFIKQVLTYPVSNNGQTVSTYLVINDGRLIKHFNGLKQKYGFKRNHLDLQSEYIFQAWSAIHKFEVKGESGWEDILDKKNTFEENRLIKYIKTTTAHKIYEFVNPHAFRTTTTDNGKRVHYTLVMEFESLDNLLTQEESGDQQPLQLTDENNTFNSTMYEYYVSYFQKWFEENRERILTKSQVTFLDDLRRCASKPYLTAEEFEKETGVRWSDYSRRIRNIEDRIERVWNKEKPNKKSRKQVYDSAKIEYFKGFLDIVENADLTAQNLLLTDYLVEGMSDSDVELEVFEIVNDCLSGDSLIEFNKIVKNNNHRNVALASQSLYTISTKVEERLEQLESAHHKKENEKIFGSEPLRKPKRKRTEVITYDKSGKVIKHEHKLEQEYIKHKNIYYILPSGAVTQQR